MNEILVRKQLKRVMSYGIPKSVAKDMVQDVVDIVGCDDAKKLEYALNYAIDLTYRLGISIKAK